MNDGCVQFNKNSWHYKLVHLVFPSFFWSASDIVNLCPYMRRVVISVLAVAFVVPWRKLPDRIQEYAWVVQGELIFLAIIVIGAGLMDISDERAGNERLPEFQYLVIYGFIGGNLIGLFGAGLILGGYALSDYIKGRPKKDHKTRGLLKTYVQSKHDKICPCVEFTDD